MGDLATPVAEIAQGAEAPPIVPGTWEAWFHDALHVLGQHSYLLVFFGSFLENTVILGFLLPGGIAVAVSSAGGRERSEEHTSELQSH